MPTSWCPSGGGGKREAGDTAAESLISRAQQRSPSGEYYAPDSVREEDSSIVDETGEC